MVQITIDTNKDSVEDIRKAVRFLEEFAHISCDTIVSQTEVKTLNLDTFSFDHEKINEASLQKIEAIPQKRALKSSEDEINHEDDLGDESDEDPDDDSDIGIKPIFY
jgi:hypothetical protein